MTSSALFRQARTNFHAALLKRVLRTDRQGVPSNADTASKQSLQLATGIADKLGSNSLGVRLAGQTAGNRFEEICGEFLTETFLRLQHLRPGDWTIKHVVGRNRLTIADYEQYQHLLALDTAAKTNPELAAALGSDYTITPDIVISRNPESDDTINAPVRLVDTTVARYASLRKTANTHPILHASISCKWTIRSDRAQNARSEGLNLVRNRKGRLPHVVVVTGEPLPSRIASLALGTGDIDCVYHFALPELQATLDELNLPDSQEMLNTMVSGKRLRDIADLPLDLAV